MKKRITQTRIVILIIRVLQLLAACGSLAAMILISGVDATTAWFLRIPVNTASLEGLKEMLTRYIYSPDLPYFILSMESITFRDGHLAALQVHPRHICSSPQHTI
jgi:hypothetical protein